jgi:hypothetical protein
MFDYYCACVVSDLWIYNVRGFTVLECSSSDVSRRFLVAYIFMRRNRWYLPLNHFVKDYLSWCCVLVCNSGRSMTLSILVILPSCRYLYSLVMKRAPLRCRFSNLLISFFIIRVPDNSTVFHYWPDQCDVGCFSTFSRTVL